MNMKLTKDLHWLNQQVAANWNKARPGGLSVPQLLALDALNALDGCNQAELVAATNVDRSTISDIMRRLATQGVVKRQRTKEDARCYAIRFTASGQKLFVEQRAEFVKVEKTMLGAAKALAASW